MTHRIKKIVKDALLSGSMFEDMGFTYLGPVDGHDVKQLTRLLRYAAELNSPVLLHVKTVKGKGYSPAEREPDRFHGIGPFDKATGLPLTSGGKNFSSVFGETMCQLAQEREELCAITAAMQSGTGLDDFAARFPSRFFDVGIAEEHAAAMAAGMAKQRALPVFAVYSSFLQRAYDMLLHDVGIQSLHVVFAVDRAGLVGEDGETHHGVFDVAYLRTVPGMTVLCPASFAELRLMLRHAVLEKRGPVAVRYPRGGEGTYRGTSGPEDPVELRRGKDVTILTYGTMVNEAIKAADILFRQGIDAQVVKLNCIAPLDMDRIAACLSGTSRLLVAEECVNTNCVGVELAARLALAGKTGIRVKLANLGDRYISQGTLPQLRTLCGIDAEALAVRATEMMDHG